MKQEKTLFEAAEGRDIIKCKRCGARCRIAGPPGTKARMLRFARGPGLCVNCAVHDFLRNTYPPNILLAQSGPGMLLYPHIQEQFAGLMRNGFADAKPDEIDWQLIVDNWKLPFPHKVKSGPMNPVTQKELDEIASGERPGIGDFTETKKSKILRECGGCITSFEQLNELDPGLGDELKRLITHEKDE